MKVLFAVNDENISTSIVKKYQKEYKEIISYKNVYYFNAILKELQRNKSYDRVVISEDLEEFTSSSYEQKDKFIFDKLDNISDEAVSDDGKDIPIILICSERRTQGEDILVKLFGIGIYNAVIEEDRSIEQVCRLINKPRSKKEAKFYYRIETEDVQYQKGKDEDVREEEIQNILLHFKKLGRNETRYVESFNNIASQYTDEQLKVIIAVLPNNVKEILKYNSPEYRKVANIKMSESGNTKNIEKETVGKKVKPVTGKLLKTDSNQRIVKPVVVPTTLDKQLYKKVTPKNKIEINPNDFDDDFDDLDELDELVEEKTKRRGRPKKENPKEEQESVQEKPKKRGRPRKNPLPEEIEENNDDLDKIISEFESSTKNNNVDEEQTENENFSLPGFDDEDETEPEPENENKNEYEEESSSLLGFDDSDNQDDEEDSFDYTQESKNIQSPFVQKFQEEDNQDLLNNNEDSDDFDDNFENLLAGEKKVVAFVGTGKNGTSFLVNNLAQILSEMKINTAIFDATKNRNAYYIYTKNDEELRNIAIQSVNTLIDGNPKGVQVNSYLTVYSGIPSQYEEIKNAYPILENLVLKHSVVLIDCDFNTPIEYFNKVQELYLVQSMDVLTIQPLTEFLRDLKAKNVLDENKIRIILNKIVRVRGVTSRGIIGGMSKYNDPEMSFMTTLFNTETIREETIIPFDEDVYTRYLEGLVECEIKLNSYPKDFKQRLVELAKKVYPLLSNNTQDKKNKKVKNNKQQYVSSFSSDMNNTLNDMRRRY